MKMSSKYDILKSGLDADMKALSSDWKIVGSDIRNAVIRFEKEVKRNNGKKGH